MPYKSFAIGTFGYYTLTGIALSKNGDTLKNQQIIVRMKFEVDTLMTDSNGIYKAKIQWITACPTGIIPWPQRWKDNNLNSKYIFFTYKNIKMKIKNDWRIMMNVDKNKPENLMKKVDLIF